MEKRRCSIEGCGREHTARGYCMGHYIRWRDGRVVGGLLRPIKRKQTTTPQERWIRETARRYGITPEEYESRRDKQAGLCAICGLKTKLFIDHDHACCTKGSCGKCVRGMLCVSCNSRLAALEDPQWVAKANAYLEANMLGS